MATGEENIAMPKSNSADAKFDMTIGYIEEMIMEDEFQELQNNFMDKYYAEFEDSEENKLCYTDIHRQYTELVEKYINQKLTKCIKEFSMEEFQKQLISRRGSLEGEIFEILVTFSDFIAFKEMMLDYKADKEGRSLDLSGGFMVTSLSCNRASNGFGVSGFSLTGTSLSIDGTGPSDHHGNHTTVMDSEDMLLDEAEHVSGEPVHDAGDGSQARESNSTLSSKSNSHLGENNDVSMESPR